MTRSQFNSTLRAAITAVPHAIGLNNHMGSLLTRHPGHMDWLMNELKEHDISYFIDSRTTHQTVALQLAKEHQVPSRKRDVFLDDDPSKEAVEKQFQRLIRVAKKHGGAIAIGHPYETTLTALEKHIPRLHEYGLVLVAASKMIYKPDIKTTPTRRLAEQTSPSPLANTSLVFNTQNQPATDTKQ